MRIVGIEDLSRDQIGFEVQQGARFVVFMYCVSIVVMTFRRGTDVYYVRPGDRAIAKGWPYALLTFLFGWWGIPWGPIYSIQCLATDLGGGRDVTEPILASLGIASAHETRRAG